MNIQKAVILPCVALILLSFSVSVTGGENNEEPLEELILNVGAQEDINTTNYLAYESSLDVWTSHVLAPVYGGVGQEDPATEEPIPYLLKGVDADESGMFELDEYGSYRKEPGTNPLEVTAYYDFNGVYSHDGVQMTIHDLLFGYHVRALNPMNTELDVLKNRSGLPGSNYTSTHWLFVWSVTDNWDADIPTGANEELTFALHFAQQTTYARFTTYTLNDALILPRHVWEGTGKVCLDATGGICDSWNVNIHSDFGYAYNETMHNGIPSTDPDAFNHSTALQWLPNSDEVVGTGPFVFEDWTPGVSASLSKYEDYKADVLDCADFPVCQGNFFKYMHKPYIDGMQFLVYGTNAAAVSALQAGDIDIIPWSIPPEFVDDLLADPNVNIYCNAERGFAYLGYNMRSSPFGYPGNDPLQGDDGLFLRKAIAHLINKTAVVDELLQGFGSPGDQPVSPHFTRWYNASVTQYDFSLPTAEQILNDYFTVGGFGLGYGPSGYRNLPTIGDGQIEILCADANYDPVQAAICSMIAENMTAVGLNATATLVPIEEIENRLDNRDMQMWVFDWRIGSDPPDYYHDLYHSDNAPAGQNYPGFQNDSFDSLIAEALAELDLNKQTNLVKQGSGLLVDALPNDVLYFRTSIQSFRADRFINWTVGPFGSIFTESFWSWIGIHPPPPDPLRISIFASSAVQSDSSTRVKASVTDADGIIVAGAPVRLTLGGSGPLGNLDIPGGDFGTTVEGVTNVNGDLIAYYEAPTTASTIQVTICAKALQFEAYPPSETVCTEVTIYPPSELFLSATVTPSHTLVEATKLLPIGILIKDQDDSPVDGALVTVTSEPSDAIIVPSSGITTAGSIGNITFRTPLLPEGTESLDYELTVNATLEGYRSTEATTMITVVPSHDQQPPEIFDVTAEPDPQAATWRVNISARVVDDYSLSLVTCQILDPSLNEIENLTMDFDATSGRFYRNRTYGAVGTHHFKIWASDPSGNMNWTTGTFGITEPPPTIRDVEWQTLSESIPTDVNVSAKIVSPIGIDMAWIRVWNPSAQEMGNFSMQRVDSTNVYWQVIPADTIGEFQFLISANDVWDRWSKCGGTFQISDVIPPDADAGPDLIITQGNVVHFNGTNSSDNWGVENYTWTFFNGTDNVTLHGPQPQNRFIVVGNFSVVLEVRDPVGNSDQDDLLVQVIVVDTDGDGLSDWDEENIYGTNPSAADTDDDGMDDGEEIALGRDPLTADRVETPLIEEFWWVFVLLAAMIIVVLAILFMLRRKKPEEAKIEEPS